MKKILITGTSSGLGKYLQERFDGVPFDRQQPSSLYLADRYDAIIHCGHPRSPLDGVGAMMAGTMSIVGTLANIDHERFILISSTDVYPKTGNLQWCEDMLIDPNEVVGAYGLSKLVAEEIVMARCFRPLVLRCGALIGGHMRPNHVTKMLFSEKPKLSLTASSNFNYIRHEIVGDLIEKLMDSDVTEILNCAPAFSTTLGALARDVQRPVEFGMFYYRTPAISTRRVRELFPDWPAHADAEVQLFQAKHHEAFS